MCHDIWVDPEGIQFRVSVTQNDTLIVPSDEPYSDSIQIVLRVKDKKYEGITLSELSDEDFTALAASIVYSFGVSDYEIAEGPGLKYIVFTYNNGLGNDYRFATILNGHMIYVYANTGSEQISDELKADIEYIALHINHGL